MSNHDQKDLYTVAKKFYHALKDAITDKEIEEQGKVIDFYFDADATINTVKGLTAWSITEKKPAFEKDRKFTLRALLTTEFLPKINFLKPHFSEFLRVLKRMPEPTKGVQKEERMNRIAEDWDLLSFKKEIPPNVTPKEYISFCQDKGLELFLSMELCFGGFWQERLSNIYRKGRLNLISKNTIDSKPEPKDGFFVDAKEILDRKRKGKYEINTELDARALSELDKRYKSGQLVRFYTETEQVRETIQEMGEIQNCLRKEEYFIIRTSFESLSFIETASSLSRKGFLENKIDDFSLEDFRRLCDDLSEIFKEDKNGKENKISEKEKKALEKRLEEMPFSDLTFTELIDEVYSLKFADMLFICWEPPSSMNDFVPDFILNPDPDVLKEADQILSKEVKVILEEIEKQVGGWKDFVHIHHKIKKACWKAHEIFSKSKTKPENIWRDLGLGRWGLENLLDEKVQNSFKNNIDLIIESDKSLKDVAFKLAIDSEFSTNNEQDAESKVHDVLVMILTFWIIKKYELINRVFKHFQDLLKSQLNQDLYDIINILDIVSLVKSEFSSDKEFEERLAHVNSITQEITKKIDAVREDKGTVAGYFYMGIAHIHYWIWKEMGHPKTGKELEWAKRSFEYGAKAIHELKPGSLALAFAINHCAYIGISGEINDYRTREYLSNLREYTGRHNHFRFMDTIALDYTNRVQKKLVELGEEVILADEQLYKQLCKDLEAACNLVFNVDQWYDDEEMGAHRAKLRSLNSQLDCRIDIPD